MRRAAEPRVWRGGLWISVLAGAAGWSGPALAGPGAAPPPDYDFQWATIDHPNNPAYDGSLGPGNVGRGSVAYDYRISKLEVTSAQWLEFINIFAPQSANPLFAFAPTHSGLVMSGGGGQGHYDLRQNVANPGMLPVFGITWRDAAMYCNWLCNGKSHDPSAILNGAYDVSTFTTNPDGTFNDQATHSPGALFWIPTLDEWIKAAHYDPNRSAPGQGGYWKFSHSSDSPPTPGAPGASGAQTSAGYSSFGSSPPSIDPLDIPLGAYHEVRSPWGLLDTSGGAREWTQGFNPFSAAMRFVDGARAGEFAEDLTVDCVNATGAFFPQFGDLNGLRVASSVPAPACAAIIVGACVSSIVTRPRRHER